MSNAEAIRVNRPGTVITVRFHTVGVPEVDLKDLLEAVRKR